MMLFMTIADLYVEFRPRSPYGTCPPSFSVEHEGVERKVCGIRHIGDDLYSCQLLGLDESVLLRGSTSVNQIG